MDRPRYNLRRRAPPGPELSAVDNVPPAGPDTPTANHPGSTVPSSIWRPVDAMTDGSGFDTTIPLPYAVDDLVVNTSVPDITELLPDILPPVTPCWSELLGGTMEQPIPYDVYPASFVWDARLYQQCSILQYTTPERWVVGSNTPISPSQFYVIMGRSLPPARGDVSHTVLAVPRTTIPNGDQTEVYPALIVTANPIQQVLSFNRQLAPPPAWRVEAMAFLHMTQEKKNRAKRLFRQCQWIGRPEFRVAPYNARVTVSAEDNNARGHPEQAQTAIIMVLCPDAFNHITKYWDIQNGDGENYWWLGHWPTLRQLLSRSSARLLLCLTLQTPEDDDDLSGVLPWPVVGQRLTVKREDEELAYSVTEVTSQRCTASNGQKTLYLVPSTAGWVPLVGAKVTFW
jgi:hypothetical protein